MKEKIKKSSSEIEEEILKRIYKKIKKEKVSDSELDKMILEEIENSMSFSEDWKIYYTKERIKKGVKEKNKKQSDKFLLGLFELKLDEKELKNQIENYNTLSFLKSARKIATASIVFIAIITSIFIMVAWFISDAWIDIILILMIAFFVYRGKKWALITIMIYWTYSKGFQIVSSFSIENFSIGNIIMPVIWWIIFMGIFYKAYQVERERGKISPNFCSNCSAKIKRGTNFCTQCGKKA